MLNPQQRRVVRAVRRRGRRAVDRVTGVAAVREELTHAQAALGEAERERDRAARRASMSEQRAAQAEREMVQLRQRLAEGGRADGSTGGS